jgi:polysaccharide biosynthesis transport protein
MSRIHEAMQKAGKDGPISDKIIIAPEHARADEKARKGRKLDETETPTARPLPTLGPTTASGPAQQTTFDVFEPLRVLLRRRWCLYVSTPVLLVLAVLFSALTPARYVATSRLQLLSQQTGRLSLGDGPADNSDGFDFYATLQTDVTVMQSDTLAMQVIRELDLGNAGEYAFNPVIKTAEVRRQMALPMDQSPLKRAAVLAKFKSSLFVDIVPGSRLITVGYRGPDPELAAKIVNRLVSDFVEYDFEVRYNATVKATDFLSRQLVDLKAEVEKSQERVVQLQKAAGMFGADENHNVIASRLEQLNDEVIAAESNRVAKEAVYNLARNGNPELVAGVLGAGANGQGSENQNALSLINHLRQQEADLKIQYAQALTQFGSAYPRVIELKNQMASVESSIQTELGKVVESAKSQYELAASQETTAKKIFEQQQTVASKMNDQAIEYKLAKNEADSSRVLYDNLLQKLKEAGVLAGLHSSDLNVVDPAVVPGSPAKPRLRTYLAGGLLAGLALGVIGAFVFEATDRTIRSPEEFESTTHTPLLGIIPQGQLPATAGPNHWLQAYRPIGSNAPDGAANRVLTTDQHAIAEGFRWVRTSLLLPNSGESPKVLMTASAVPQEGKSFSALNLAAALTQNGCKVLLVDADLRRGTLSKIIKHDSANGLSELLLGKLNRPSYQHIDEVPGLMFMPSGALLSSPADLLASERMSRIIEEWRREFAYVIIDTPPLLPVSDAVVLASRVDSVIVVARSGFTQRTSIVRAIRVLRNANVKYVSVLVNGVDSRSAEYCHYYGSYGSDGNQHKDPNLLTIHSSGASL